MILHCSPILWMFVVSAIHLCHTDRTDTSTLTLVQTSSQHVSCSQSLLCHCRSYVLHRKSLSRVYNVISSVGAALQITAALWSEPWYLCSGSVQFMLLRQQRVTQLRCWRGSWCYLLLIPAVVLQCVVSVTERVEIMLWFDLIFSFLNLKSVT